MMRTIPFLGLTTFMAFGGCVGDDGPPAAASAELAAQRDHAAKKRVIILCTGNSCRSQMAEAFWRLYAGDTWDVVSAGTKPSGKVSPLAVEAMQERGIDISSQKSKSLEPFLTERFDLVVTVCGNAEKTCPTFRGGGKHVHHGFDDPPHAPGTYADQLKVCRRVRDEIDIKVKEWIAAEDG